MSAVTFEFDGYIRDLLEVRKHAGPEAPNDATTPPLHELVPACTTS